MVTPPFDIRGELCRLSPVYIFHRYHLHVFSSYLSSKGRRLPLISDWQRKRSIRLPASFSSVTVTLLILSSWPSSLNRKGWGLPFSNQAKVDDLFLGLIKELFLTWPKFFPAFHRHHKRGSCLILTIGNVIDIIGFDSMVLSC